MSENVNRKQAGHILWNAAIVLAFVAIVLLFINNRQLAGALAQLDRQDQEQIAKLQQDLSQTSAAAEKSADSLARQRRDSRAS